MHLTLVNTITFQERALQEFVDLDWRAMEFPVLALKYRKNYGYDHARQSSGWKKCGFFGKDM
jgi:hypothetical protein